MEASENGAGGVYGRIGELAACLGLKAGAEGIAALAAERGFGEAELSAIEAVLAQEAEERKAASIDTLIRLSRLPKREPRTFEGFDFSRIQGRDVKALRALPELSDLVAGRNIAFIGPEGIGKTHLAQAYGYECCRQGYRTYYLKATELRDRLMKASSSRSTPKCVSALVKPSCLIIDEIGRCTFDRDCTDLFFDIVDRRYEKEGPNSMVLTSNTDVSGWKEFFTGDGALLCALDRIFDRASVFVMSGPSFRGRSCETLSVEAVPTVARARA